MENNKKIDKDFFSRAKSLAKSFDKHSIELFAENTRKTFQDKLVETGLDEHIKEFKVQVKEDSKLISDSVLKTAKNIYVENESFLNKPVSFISDNYNENIKPHAEKIKWAGIVAAGVVAPVTALVASSVFYLLSDDDAKKKISDDNNHLMDNGLNKSEVVKHTAAKIKNENVFENKVLTENQWVSVVIDLQDKSATGIILKGKLKGRTFEDIGIENMVSLMNMLPDEPDANDAKGLINHWVYWRNSKK